jgi:hypothetical protein
VRYSIPVSDEFLALQVKQLHAAITFKHKRMLEQTKQDRDTTIGVALGVGLGIAAVGLGFLLAGGRRK